MGDELEEGDLLRVELEFFPHDGMMGCIGRVFVRSKVSALRWLLEGVLAYAGHGVVRGRPLLCPSFLWMDRTDDYFGRKVGETGQRKLQSGDNVGN